MSSLHVWFTKLKWNMDVLLRFYERHAFICALHKETRLLFDELVFCLQRLYSVPIHIDLPFSSEILDDIPLSSSTASTPTSCSCCTGSKHDFSKLRRQSKSRIPRPISLPKRLESKLSVENSEKSKPPRPSTADHRKSRVRDTVKLFDSKNTRRNGSAPSMKRRVGGPKTGAGEAMMALEDSGGKR